MQVKLSTFLLLVALLFVSIQAAPASFSASANGGESGKRVLSTADAGETSGLVADAHQTDSSKSVVPKSLSDFAVGAGKSCSQIPKRFFQLLKALEKKGMTATVLKILFGPIPKKKKKPKMKNKSKK